MDKESKNLQMEIPIKGPTYKENPKDKANINGKQGLFMKANSKTGCVTDPGFTSLKRTIINIMDCFLTTKSRAAEPFIL
jgi:hypothetical protein